MEIKNLPFDCMRKIMVEGQLIPRGISDEKVLKVFQKVRRHKFVPEELLESSYEDYPLPIGDGQTISQPFMVALMTQCLSLNGGERVLEIGTGSGYQMAILAEIAQEVYSVERFADLAERAGKTLSGLGYKNFKIKVGDGTLGWDAYAPYDGILVTAAAPDIPPSLVKQLKDRGRLVIPVGGEFSQMLTIIERQGENLRKTEVCSCVFVPLVGKEGWPDLGQR